MHILLSGPPPRVAFSADASSTLMYVPTSDSHFVRMWSGTTFAYQDPRETPE
jgi:hypothetical protein